MTNNMRFLGFVLMMVFSSLSGHIYGQLYATIDGADVVKAGEIELSPINARLFSFGYSTFNTEFITYGARVGVGLGKNFDVKIRFDIADFNGESAKILSIAPKYQIGSTGFAVALPIMAIDGEGFDSNFGLKPQIFYSKIICKKGLELAANVSRTDFVNSSDGWYTFAAGPAFKKDKYAVRIEVGYDLLDNDRGYNYIHYGFALSYLIP